MSIQVKLNFQENPVEDEVSALIAVVRPVLEGILYSLKREVVDEQGGHDQIKLFMLPRLRRPGDGDVGICFEYAVHDAIINSNPMVMDRVNTALGLCNLRGSTTSSILFGAEKAGALNLIDTARRLLTPQSQLMYGTAGRPVKLKRHIDSVAAAFRKVSVRNLLPQSISGLWKADLFIGYSSIDNWVGTALKINRRLLEGGRGLRIGIIPTQEGESDSVRRDNMKNLIICPLPYDHSFMQIFYQAWEIVVQFLDADSQLPPEVNLPRPPSRQVARFLADRRQFPVLEVVQALLPLSQPGLMQATNRDATLIETRTQSTSTTSALIAPIPKEGT